MTENNILEKIDNFLVYLTIIFLGLWILLSFLKKRFFYLLCLLSFFFLILFIIWIYKRIIIKKILKEISPQIPKWMRKLSEILEKRKYKKNILKKPNLRRNTTRIHLSKLKCFTNPKDIKKVLEKNLKEDKSKIKLKIDKKYNKKGMILTKNHILLISPIQEIEFEDLYNKIKFSKNQVLSLYPYCYSQYSSINEKYLKDALKLINYFGNEEEIFFHYPIDLEAPFYISNSIVIIWITPIIEDEAI